MIGLRIILIFVAFGGCSLEFSEESQEVSDQSLLEVSKQQTDEFHERSDAFAEKAGILKKSSPSDSNENNSIVILHENGRKQTEYYLVDGLMEGAHREWFASGQLKNETFYKSGQKNGSRKTWYESGVLKTSGAMLHDRWDGIYEEWHGNGQPSLIGFYHEGKQHGKWRFYNEIGKTLPSLSFENGIEVTRKLSFSKP